MSDGLSVKQLGETEDPAQLVPGAPDKVRTASGVLADEGTHMGRVHTNLVGLSAPAWEGRSADVFNAGYPSSLKPWTRVGDDLGDASTALDDHAGVIEAAQETARQAIAKYRRGEEQTRDAITRHDAAVADYNRAITVPPSSIGGGGPRPTPSRPGPFVDPGVGLRTEAQEMVDDARERVADSAEAAGRALGRLPGAMTGEVDGPENGWDIEAAGTIAESEGVRNWRDYERQFGDGAPQNTDTDDDGVTDDVDPDVDGDGLTDVDDPDVRSDSDDPDSDSGTDVTVDLGSVEAGDSVYGLEGSVTDQYGPVTANAQGGVYGIGYDANAGLSVGRDGLQAEAGASGYLGRAEGSASLAAGPAEIGVQGEAMVGAEAEAELGVGPTGVHAGGEAFVGGKIEGSVSGEVGGVGATGTAEGWAGAGIEADVNVGMNDDGSFTVGGNFGAALGIGGKLGGEITIDPGEVMDTAGDIADGIGDGLDSLGDGIGSLF